MITVSKILKIIFLRKEIQRNRVQEERMRNWYSIATYIVIGLFIVTKLRERGKK